MKKLAATYLRVSRSDQRSGLQRDETTAYVKRRGWKLGRVYSDEGISGGTGRRPGFLELLTDARAKRFDVVVVYKLDRMFRSLRDIVNTLYELNELEIAFVSVTQSIDSSTSMGRLAMNQLAAFAEFERDMLRERTVSGLAAAKRRGARIGRPRRHVDVDTVRRLREQGHSMEAIATELGVGEATLYRAIAARTA